MFLDFGYWFIVVKPLRAKLCLMSDVDSTSVLYTLQIWCTVTTRRK